MMTVSYKVALWLKEQGYNEPQTRFYSEDGKLHISSDITLAYRNSEIKEGLVSAPAYVEVWVWLWRAKRQLLNPSPQYRDGHIVGFTGIDPNQPHYTMLYPDPETALASIIDDMVK